MHENNDAAERAARRKSAHFAPLAAGKENASATASPAERKALALQGQRKAKRLSAVASAPPVSLEVMNTNFEEWMKLATDNVSGVAGDRRIGDVGSLLMIENHIDEYVELCAYRLLSRLDVVEEWSG